MGTGRARNSRDIRDLTAIPGSTASISGVDNGVQIASTLADFGSTAAIIEEYRTRVWSQCRIRTFRRPSVQHSSVNSDASNANAVSWAVGTGVVGE